MQSIVFGVGFQFVFEFVFEFVFVRDFAGFVPLFVGVVVSYVLEFGCRSAVFVERTSYLRVVSLSFKYSGISSNAVAGDYVTK